jgi:hypothetical protein
VAERQAQYEQVTQEKARLIRDTEAKNVKLGKKKLRGIFHPRVRHPSNSAQTCLPSEERWESSNRTSTTWTI